MASFFQEFKKFWTLWIAASFFIVIFGFLAFGEFQRWFDLKSEIKEHEVKIQKLASKAEQASADIANVSDPNYLEKEARLTLNLKREGEEVFVVVGLDDITKEEDFSNVFSQPVENQDKFWFNIKSWWQYFFNPED